MYFSTPTITQNGDTLISGSTTGNQWYWKGSAITNATSQNYTLTQNGYYLVIATDANGCSTISDTLNITNAGIKEIENSNSVIISPNPFSTSATVTITSPLERGKGCVFVMYDLLGREVYKSAITNSQTAIKRGNLPEGMYFYKVTNSQEIIGTGKLVISH